MDTTYVVVILIYLHILLFLYIIIIILLLKFINTTNNLYILQCGSRLDIDIKLNDDRHSFLTWIMNKLSLVILDLQIIL